jgi:hypothetical protein
VWGQRKAEASHCVGAEESRGTTFCRNNGLEMTDLKSIFKVSCFLCIFLKLYLFYYLYTACYFLLVDDTGTEKACLDGMKNRQHEYKYPI